MFDEERKALRAAFLSDVDDDEFTSLRLKVAPGLSADLCKALSKTGAGGVDLLALSLVPLVHVAWADGSMHKDERAAILKAAGECGVSKKDAAYTLLDARLASAPTPLLLQAWKSYLQAVLSSLTPGQRAAIGEGIMSFASEVAAAAGGFLGIGAVSASEERALQVVRAALTSRERMTIVLAEGEGTLRTGLAEALQELGFTVVCKDDGDEVVELIGGGAMAKLVVLGRGLEKYAPSDVLFLAERARASSTGPRVKIAMLTDIVSDAEVLEIYRKRGVVSFASRDRDLEELVDWVNDIAYYEQRAEPRHNIKRNVTLLIGDSKVSCKTSNLSLSGAQVSAGAGAFANLQLPEIGDRIELALDLASQWETVAASMRAPEALSMFGVGMAGGVEVQESLQLDAIVRATRTGNRFLGGTVILGLQFVDMDEESCDELRDLFDAND